MNLFQKKIHVPTENLSSLMQQRCSAVGWDRRAQKRFLFYEFICIFVIIVFLFGEDAFRQWFSLVRNFLYLINWEQFPGHGLGIIFKWNMPEIACDKQLFGPSLCWRIWGLLKSWDYFFYQIQIKFLFLCMHNIDCAWQKVQRRIQAPADECWAVWMWDLPWKPVQYLQRYAADWCCAHNISVDREYFVKSIWS